jgi:hypothetical protein
MSDRERRRHQQCQDDQNLVQQADRLSDKIPPADVAAQL